MPALPQFKTLSELGFQEICATLTNTMSAVLMVLVALSADGRPDRFTSMFQRSGQAVLQSSPSIIVFSLSPHPVSGFNIFDRTQSFHGYKILGSVELRGEAKDALLGKLYTSIAEEATAARCFNPRHGIRASSNGSSVDLVICFQCRQLESYIDGKKGGGLLSDSAERLFNDVLRAAKVPLSQD